MWTERANYGLITVHAPFFAIGPNQKSLDSLTRDEKFRELCSMECFQKILYFANSKTIFRFRFFSEKKAKLTQSATIVLTLWIYRTEDKLHS